MGQLGPNDIDEDNTNIALLFKISFLFASVFDTHCWASIHLFQHFFSSNKFVKKFTFWYYVTKMRHLKQFKLLFLCIETVKL